MRNTTSYRTVMTYTKRDNCFLVQVKYDITKGGSSCQKCIYRTINVVTCISTYHTPVIAWSDNYVL